MPYIVLSFFVYSFVGWVWETIPCSIVTQKKIINRGFLNGPYCPIYGVGALMNWCILRNFDNPVILFFAGMIMATAVEYLTSYLMERFFQARWWDYSDMPLNINGRVCIYGALIFGIGSVLVIKWIQPYMNHMLRYIPEHFLGPVSLIVLLAFGFDILVTSCSIIDFNARLERIAELVSTKGRWYLDKSKFTGKAKEIKEILMHRRNAFGQNQKRIMIAFPKLKSIRYLGLIDRIKQLLFSEQAVNAECEEENENETGKRM